MSETDKLKSPTILTIDNDELHRLFYEAKSNDFTRSQFEQEKTKRIVALCEALRAVPMNEAPNGYIKTPRDEILFKLVAECNSVYSPVSLH